MKSSTKIRTRRSTLPVNVMSTMNIRVVCWLLLLLISKTTTSGFSSSCYYFRTRGQETPLRLLLHASTTRTRNSRGISLFSKMNNNIIDHHHDEELKVSTKAFMEHQKDDIVVNFPPLLLLLSGVAAATVSALVGASSIMPLPAHAAAATADIVASTITTAAATTTATGMMPSTTISALWAYGHYVSIIIIFGCLSVERTLVKANMSVDDENTVVKLDIVYGIMAALLIISGLFRATDYGKGGDFYIHEPLFWAKMTFSGIWGGLSIFPSITFYKRNFARKDGQQDVLPLSEKLAKRIQQVINAEITAVLSIPLLATLMSRGIWYQPDFPWPAGLVLSLVAMGGSFYIYGKQALTWTEKQEKDE